MNDNQTIFMQRIFSAQEKKEEAVLNQVADDIKSAKANGVSGDDQVTYQALGDDKVLVTDNVHQEQTIIEDSDDPEVFDMYDAMIVPEDEMDKYLHPEADGVTPDEGVENLEDMDCAWTRAEKGVVSPGVPGDTVDHDSDDPDLAIDMEPERAFSYVPSNTVIQRIYSDEDFCIRVFSEVLESEETATVGNLKVEKVDDDEIVVTDTESGDQAKIGINDDGEVEVTELNQKELCGCYSEIEDGDLISDYEGNVYLYSATDDDFYYVPEEYLYSEDEDDENPELDLGEDTPGVVVGIAPVENQLVEVQISDEDDPDDVVDYLESLGVTGIEVFEDQDEAREHAMDLLQEAGATDVDDNAHQANFSETGAVMYLYSYASDDKTEFMERLFSDTEDGCECHEMVNDAIESGEQVEDDDKVITPIDAKSAVIEDKESGDFTKATVVDGDELEVEKISEDEADTLTNGLAVDDDDDDDEDEEEEKNYSDVIDLDDVSNFMLRMFSDSEDGIDCQEQVADAIESGEQVEEDDKVITPIDATTAIVEDKRDGDFTKVTMTSDEDFDVEKISEEEADKLTDGLAVEDDEEEEESEGKTLDNFLDKKGNTNKAEKIEVPEDDDEDEDEDEEREYSTLDGFFSETEEPMTPEEEQAMAEEQAAMEAQQGADPAITSVENIEDKALNAVQAIQEASNSAVQAIQQAKEAPAPGENEDIREAEFSQRGFCEADYEGATLDAFFG